MNLSVKKIPTFVIVHEKPSKFISGKMTNDGEIVWHIKSDSQEKYYNYYIPVSSFQDSLDQCPIPINADQNSGIDPNVD